MAAAQPLVFSIQELTNLGSPLAGGRVYTYLPGTTTHQNAYTDEAGTTPHTYTSDGVGGQYIALNARGELDNPFYITVAIDITLKTAAGATIWTRKASSISSGSGLAIIGFTQSGSGSVERTAQDKLREVQLSVKDKGATGLGVVSDTAAFTAAGSDTAGFEAHVTPGIYKLDTTPAPTQDGMYIVHNGATFTGSAYLPDDLGMIKYGGITDLWVTPLWSGIFEYMGEQSVLNVRAKSSGLGIHSAVRSSTGGGIAGQANICYSAFGYGDYVGGGEGTWGYYATMLRAAGHTGAIHGMEIDMGNLGSDVELYPAAMFAAGGNNPLWLASGGEAAFASPAATMNNASCALGIISNDPANNARFLKGILFHNKAIDGVEGDGVGRGAALALSPGHSFIYFNNSNSAVGEFSCTNTDATKGLWLDLSEFGMFVYRRNTSKLAFAAGGTLNGVNYFNLANSVTGSAVEMQALGDDTNIDMYLVPKGTGRVRFGTAVGSGGDVPCAVLVSFKDNGGTVRQMMCAS
jgi:hypothetical protein